MSCPFWSNKTKTPAKGQRRSPIEGEGNYRALFYEKNYLYSK